MIERYNCCDHHNNRHNDDLGYLIDLSQIKGGPELKRIIKEFNSLQTSVKYQIDNAFQKKFMDMVKKYEELKQILIEGNLDALEKVYVTELQNLLDRVKAHEEYSERTYMKKTDLIGMDNLSEDLKETLYSIISGAGGDTSGYGVDYNGNLRKVKWTMYFVLFADKMVYLKNVKNKTSDSTKTISWEDWYGENYTSNDFSSNCVELWAYNRPSESYLSLFYLPVTGDFDNSINYYMVSNDMYILWNKNEYDPSTWDTVKKSLYYFNSTSYENELIDVLESSNYAKTYVFRNLGEYSDTANENDKDRIEPVCGRVSFNADSQRFTFDNVAQSRYVFKLIKYEY